MKTFAAFIKKTGSPSVIEWGEIELPPLRDNDVLVKVEAVAVNHVDTYFRSGKMGAKLPLPYIIGKDFVGTVEKLGNKAQKFKVGQKVWCNTAGNSGRQGCTAEHVIAEERFLYPLPEGVDPLQIVALAEPAATACRGMINAATIQATETILVNGGAGSVGSALIQLCRARGARVIATTTGADKIAWCQELGAEAVIDYEARGVAEQVKALFPEGVHIFWDTSNEPHFELATQVLKPHGRIIVMAGAEAKPPFPVGAFYRQELTMRGFSLFFATPEELAGYAEIINRCTLEGLLKAKIAKVLPLAKAAEAHTLIEKKDTWGKIVLTS